MAKLKVRWYNNGFHHRKLTINRKYKDRLFRHLFKNKKDLLELYNAVNNSAYTDEDELEIITLDDVIFMKMKNDLSFMIANSLNLYEHQSTYSPNMPLRGLIYFARQYEGLIGDRKDRIYGSKLIKIPTPVYIVFYNGTEKDMDQMELYLSDAFEDGRGSGCLECKARLININRGHNRELLEKCRRLWEYSEFISEVHDQRAKGYSLKKAVMTAMDSCIERGILSDILAKDRAEVLHMLLTEYDEKKHMKYMYQDGYEDGELAGKEAGRNAHLEEQVRKKLEKGKSLEVIAEELEEEIEVIRRIVEQKERR